ncbi:hypothetical protein FIBSPDRAFT_856235 [Athelia psychrophila]|uniref:Uncharacterized protein n=1 Tax=Athelia psychrophila TaxID=1759441 RepID=A0A166NPM6_9AGAM|nr:hypothetical protein FIBSPDRAFT_856235 [Fibularhizoctonia sp. CBS 109695]
MSPQAVRHPPQIPLQIIAGPERENQSPDLMNRTPDTASISSSSGVINMRGHIHQQGHERDARSG